MSLKRVLALVLALTMIFSLAMPGSWAFAEDDGIIAVEDEYNEEGIVEESEEEAPAITEETPDVEEPAAEEIVAEQPAEETEEESEESEEEFDFDFDELSLEDTDTFEATMRVQVGENKENTYATLSKAIDAAQPDDTVKLLRDIELTAPVEITKNLTIDLNGCDIYADSVRALHIKSGTVEIIGEGTIEASGSIDKDSSVIRVGDGTTTAPASLTIGEDVLVTSDVCYGVTVFGKNNAISFTLDGTVNVSGANTAVSGNGSEGLTQTTMVINGSAIAANDYAIYHPGMGTLTVNGTVQGTGGIEIKSGELIVGANASIRATADTQSHVENNNGCSTSGYAIAAVSNQNYHSGDPSVEITGGTISGKVSSIADSKGDTKIVVITATDHSAVQIPDGYGWNSEGHLVEEKTVTFKSEDGRSTYTDLPVLVGDKVATPTDIPGMPGFSLVWVKKANCTRDELATQTYNFNEPVNDNFTLYGYFSRESYTLTIDLSGGKYTTTAGPVSDVITRTVAFDRAVGDMPVASNTTLNGYTFRGLSWKIGEDGATHHTYADGEAPAEPVPTKMPAGDLLVKVDWQAITSTITFNPDNGKETWTQAVTYPAAVVRPDDPAKTGYTFAGWFRRDNAWKWGWSATTDLTLKAKWEAAESTITFNADGGKVKGEDTYRVATNSDATISPAIKGDMSLEPTRDGYTFAGWYHTVNGKEEKALISALPPTMPAGGDTYIAHWTANEYTVKFNPTDDAVGTMTDQTFTYGVEQKLTANAFTRNGYSFAGWATTESPVGGEETYANEESVINLATKGVVPLYTRWTLDTYTITFETDGEPVEDGSYNYTNQAVLPVATKTGYEFAGWKVKGTDGNWTIDDVINPGSYPLMFGNVTLTAQWNKYVAQLTDGADNKTPYTSIGAAKIAYDAASNMYHGIEILDPAAEYKLDREGKIVVLNPGDWEPQGDMSIDKVQPYYVKPSDPDDNGAVTFSTVDCEAQVFDLTVTVTRDATWNYHTNIASALSENKKTFAEAVQAVVNQTGNVNTKQVGTYSAKAVKVLGENVEKYALQAPDKIIFIGTVDEPAVYFEKIGVHYTSSAYLEGADLDENQYTILSAALNTKTVKFDAGLGIGTATNITVTYGAPSDLPVAGSFTRENYSFDGYKCGEIVISKDAAALTADEVNELIALGDEPVTLTAQYVGVEYTATFTDLGTKEGEAVADVVMTVPFGSSPVEAETEEVKVPVAAELEKHGYHLANQPWLLVNEDETTIAFTQVANYKMPARNVTIKPNWVGDNFSIKFNANSGKGTLTPVDALYGATVMLPAANKFTMTGFTFAGWNTAADGTGDYSFENAAELTADQVNALYDLAEDGEVTLYAKWTVNNYTIVFDANDKVATGTTLSVNATYGVPATLTANGFTKTGYSFTGWNVKADGTGKPYADSESVTNLSTAADATVTLYAQWEPDTFTIAFDKNDDAATGSTKSVTGTYDAAATLTTNGFKKTGYGFSNWSASDGTTFANKKALSAAEVNALYALAEEIDGVKTVTLTANWNPSTFKVNFNVNGGEGTMNALSVIYDGEAVEIPDCVFTKAGNQFASWNTKADGSGRTYEVSESVSNITANLTLYAQWEPDTFDVVFNGNNSTGGAMENFELTYGVTGKYLPENGFNKTGFTFAGWSLNAEAETADFAADKDLIGPTRLEALYAAKSEDDTVTLYAIWTAKEYAITFNGKGGKLVNPDGRSVNTYTVTGMYGDSITWPADPTRTGYTFAGWDHEAFNTIPDAEGGELTVNATWTVNQYTVSFYDKAPDGTITKYEDKDITANYNTAFTAPTVTKDGFEFAKWVDAEGKDKPTKIPAADTSYYATWTGKEVTITFIDRSETIKTGKQANGDETVAPSFAGRTNGAKIVDPDDPWSPQLSKYVDGAAVYMLKWKDILSVDFIASGIKVGTGSAIDGHPITDAPDVKKDGLNPVWHINSEDGEVYTIGETPINSSIKTLVATWGGEEPVDKERADFTYNMSLTDSLNMKYYVRNVRNGYEYDKFAITVTVDGEESQTFVLSNKDENVFQIASLDARRMTDNIHVDVSYDGETFKSDDYSIQAYCEAVLAQSTSEQLNALVNAVLVYGANAQVTLNYNPDNPPIDSYDVSGVVIPSMKAVKRGQATGVTNIGDRIRVEASITLDVVIQLADGVDPTNIKAYVDSETDARTLTKLSGNLYYVSIPVSALRLDTNHTVTLEAEDGSYAMYSGSALAPLSRAANDLAKAVYAYFNAAQNYYGSF